MREEIYIYIIQTLLYIDFDIGLNHCLVQIINIVASR